MFGLHDPVAALRQWRECWLPESIDPRPWVKRCGYKPAGVHRVWSEFTASRYVLDEARRVCDVPVHAAWAPLTIWSADATAKENGRARPGDPPTLNGRALAVGDRLHVEGGRSGLVSKAPHKNAAYRSDEWFLTVGAVRLPLTVGLRACRDLSPSEQGALAAADRTITKAPAKRDELGFTKEDRNDLRRGVHTLPLELLAAGLERTPAEVRAAVDALGLRSSLVGDGWLVGGAWLDLTPSRLGEKLGFSTTWERLPKRAIATAIGCSATDAHRHRRRLRTPSGAFRWICDVAARCQAKGAALCPVCAHHVDRLVGKTAGEPACRPCAARRARARKKQAT